MQNRYVGDIGDFGKLGLLRALSSKGLSIGVNWYLTTDESHNGDGRHVDYLAKAEYRACDAALCDTLKYIITSNQRETAAIERSGILSATYYSVPIACACRSKADRLERRKCWHINALKALRGIDLVYLDPDNGLMVPSGQGTARMGKYVEAREIADYYRQGSSVIYYQHKARKQDVEYAMQFHDLLTAIDIPQARGLGLKFISTSQRFYFFVIQPRHESIIRDCVAQMLTTGWNKHFCLVEPNEAGDTIPQRRERSMNETKKAVISVLGTDKKGIIAQVSRILYENDANILDITQTIVSGLFSMILIADVSSEGCSFDTLKTELDALSGRIGVQIRTQRSEIFEAMHQI